MATTAAPPADAAAAPPSAPAEEEGRLQHGSMGALMVGASGVVFGDIGTSPLYALQETMVGPHPLPITLTNIYGVISLIFWTMVIIVTGKYVFTIMRADNNGEGGSLALLALVRRKTGTQAWTPTLVALALFATGLFYGDSIITPAVSVLSAVEGLKTLNPKLDAAVLPISLVILIGLFLFQSRGTARVGRLFGPVMLVYFVVLALLGIANIRHHPEVLWALSPVNIVRFFEAAPLPAFLSLGSVILAVTGAEALYADMGHFGRQPIVRAWLSIVFPALILNYLGQAALLSVNPAAASSLFFMLAPDNLRLPLIILATLATIIASQAVITGAYSVTQQAIQLGFLPRMRILQTSDQAAGQIYVPLVNWGLLIAVVVLVVAFGSSARLLPAYGLAVMGTMFITVVMLGFLIFKGWRRNLVLGGLALALFVAIDAIYLASNLSKVREGGWLPLLIGLAVFILLSTWAAGRQLVIKRLEGEALPVDVFVKSAAATHRVRGTAVFMTSSDQGVPHALLHNLKHNQVLHERVVLLTVRIANVPTVPLEKRATIEDLGQGFWRIILKFGFMEELDVPAALRSVAMCGPKFEMMKTTFFLSRQTLLPSAHPGMALWREKLFAWMLRNAETPMEFFRLPPNRVVELGSQVEI